MAPVVNDWARSRRFNLPIADSVCPTLLTRHAPAQAALASSETTISKVSLPDTLPSLAVTVTETVPTSALAGVPERVRVSAAKLSQKGSAESSDWVAV